jgi:hypothetical protein
MKYAFVFLVLFQSSIAFSQTDSLNFKKAYLVKVYLTGRKQVEGIFKTISDSTLTILENKSNLLTLASESIYKLEVKKYNKSRNSTIIGAAIGFSAGCIIGWQESDDPGVSDQYKLGRAAGGGLLGGFAGAFVGGIIGKFSKTYLILGNPRIFYQFKSDLLQYQQP